MHAVLRTEWPPVGSPTRDRETTCPTVAGKQRPRFQYEHLMESRLSGDLTADLMLY